MEQKSKPWTKRELRVVTKPVEELAKAVIWQWHLDGEPKSDLPAIEYWKWILKESSERK